MIVYRICLEKWSKKLRASGRAARWNSDGVHLIYTAGSRALACLENLVHRSGEGFDTFFRLMIIEIPDDVNIGEIKEDGLPKTWYEGKNYLICRTIGDLWLKERTVCVLKVPSAIIPEEFNYLIHPNHPDFNKISIIKTLPFKFDRRFSGK
jgi:RES domain-containing protein